RALKTVRTRIEGYGVSEAVVQKTGNDRIAVQIPGVQDPARARKLVQEQAFLQFMITDKTQALERDLPRLDQVVKQRGLIAKAGATSAAVAPSAATKGLQGLLTTADTSKKSDTTKKAAAAAAKDSSAAKDSAAKDSLKLQPGGAFSSLFQQGGMPGEFYVETDKVPLLDDFLADTAVQAAMPPGKSLLPSTDSASLQGKWYRAFYLVDSKPIITGEYLNNARPAQSPTGEGPIVEFEMDNVGGRRFRAETGKHINDYMAIVLDGRVMGRPPVIESAIGTR